MGGDAHERAYGVSVLLPAYQRGPHVKRTILSWVQAWMADVRAAPARLELVIVDDGAGDGRPELAVDLAWVAEAVRSWREVYAAEAGARRSLTIRVVRVDYAGRKRSKSSVSALNHAAAVARGDVLVLSNAESYALFGGMDAEVAVRAHRPVGTIAPPVGAIGADPRLGVASWTPSHGDLRPFEETCIVWQSGGYTVGSCVNAGKGVGDVGEDALPRSVPPDVRTPAVDASALLAAVPMTGMRTADDHAWRSHPSWRPTDLHWASVIRRSNFWGAGGFSARWAQSPTGWGEDGEFAWRVRLCCDGVREHRGEARTRISSAILATPSSPRPFRVSTNLMVVHQWHPSAGGTRPRDVAEGEALYDVARRDALWAAARGELPWGHVQILEALLTWKAESLAFPDATVTSHLFEAAGYAYTP